MKKNPIEILNEPEPIPPPEAGPELPHEKDESTAAMVAQPRKIIKRAGDDLKRGLKDTDRGPEMAKTYWKQR